MSKPSASCHSERMIEKGVSCMHSNVAAESLKAKHVTSPKSFVVKKRCTEGGGACPDDCPTMLDMMALK